MSSVLPLDPGAASPADLDLDNPELYLNRELTWLSFNQRVLAEAENEDNPLLERVKFLSIFDSNLDEFFMKRIGGLKQQVGAGVDAVTVDGRSPLQQIDECSSQVGEALADRAYIYSELLQRLADAGIRIERCGDLEKEARALLRRTFKKNVMPLLTPLAIDEAHPFPFMSNLSVNLLLKVWDRAESTPHFIRIKVPVAGPTSRFMQVGEELRFVALEDVIAENLDLLLPGAEVLSVGYFRVTRNAIVERNEELANDLLEMIEDELKERRFAPVVRLEVSPGLDEDLRRYLATELGLSRAGDIFVVSDMLGVRDMMALTGLDRPDLKFPPFEPAPHPRLAQADSVFDELDDNGPLLLKHPFQSFDHSFTRFLREAVDDPNVLAIKTTVYRTSRDSAIIPLLVKAVTRGKQVAVVVELQARFDEAANIGWANRLEEAGIHVSYGVVGFKTHAKATLIVRQKPDEKLRRYVHISTGNYHSVTARQYCDVALMTADSDVGKDATELFNLLTSGSLSERRYRKLLVSPNHMKTALLDKIRREIECHESHGNGHIRLKTNALEDADITRALYEASYAGVRIDLLVRDTCRFRPGIAGLSHSARVISILGRFLEHARVYYFHNNGNEEYYIGSADLMTRNLESRVEAIVPIDVPSLQSELRELLDLQLNDTCGSWEMDANGVYHKVAARSDAVHSQFKMLQDAAFHAGA